MDIIHELRITTTNPKLEAINTKIAGLRRDKNRIYSRSKLAQDYPTLECRNLLLNHFQRKIGLMHPFIGNA
jgi:hypothetical protein